MIFGKKAQEKVRAVEPSDRVSIFDTDYPIDKSNWFQVYSACLGKVMVIQNACAEQVVKKRGWNVDFGAGTLSFGNDSYPVQFLGSESSYSNTWMWGWNNINGFDEKLLTLAKETKKTGEAWNLEPLTVDTFDLDDTFNGHSLSIVACGISKEHYCYYRGPHDNGAVLMAFSGVTDSVFGPVNADDFISTVLDCIQKVSVEHRIFTESFLMWTGTKYDWKGNDLIAHFPQDVVISFEQAENLWRIVSLKTVKQAEG